MSHGKFSLKCLKKPKKGLEFPSPLYIDIFTVSELIKYKLIKHIISINSITKELGDFIKNH